MEPSKHLLTKSCSVGWPALDDPSRRLSELIAVLVMNPCSNAAVERSFSQMALKQTDLRNRLSADQMRLLLRVSKPELMLPEEEECDNSLLKGLLLQKPVCEIHVGLGRFCLAFLPSFDVNILHYSLHLLQLGV